jgi:hypothetical protein
MDVSPEPIYIKIGSIYRQDPSVLFIIKNICTYTVPNNWPRKHSSPFTHDELVLSALWLFIRLLLCAVHGQLAAVGVDGEQVFGLRFLL